MRLALAFLWGQGRVLVKATVACRPATFPLRAVRARSVGGVRRRGSGRAVTPEKPLGFPGGSRRVVVPAQPPVIL